MKTAFRKFCPPDFNDHTLRFKAAPRTGIGFVLEFGNDDFVAWFKNSRECPCELKGQGRGTRADHDLSWFAVQKFARLEAGLDFDVRDGYRPWVGHSNIA
jgi:hypothetical protein